MQTKSSKIVALFLLATTIVAYQSSWGYNNNWADASNTQAYGTAASNGNGYSAVSASGNGVTTQAYGTNGSLSNSGFNQNTNSWGVSNGYNTNLYGNNAYSNNWADISATQAQTNAEAFGQGGVASNVGRDGGNVFAQGTLGTVSQLQYNNSENAWNTQFAYGNNRRLLTDTRRNNRYPSDSDSCEDDNNYHGNHQNNGNSWGWNNNWANNSKTNAYGEAQSYGNGYSAVSAGRKGVNTEAYGKEGAASKSSFEQNNNSWGISNGFNNNGNGNNAFSNNWGSNDATKSFTHAQGFGEAGVKSQSDKDGADVFAQGTKGTNTGLGWQNNDNSWNSSFAFGNNKRNLIAQKEESCSEEDHDEKRQHNNRHGLSDQDKKLVDDLRREIHDLKKENEELRRQCGKNNGKGVGASN